MFRSWQKSKAKKRDVKNTSKQTSRLEYYRADSMTSEYGGSSSASSGMTDYIDEEYIEKKMAQIEMDAQFALEIFEQENIRDPIDGTPLYLSDYGINSATVSLRQIMAEQAAEEYRKKNYLESRVDVAGDPTLAIRIKRRQLHEVYSDKIDRRILDSIFVQHKYAYLKNRLIG